MEKIIIALRCICVYSVAHGKSRCAVGTAVAAHRGCRRSLAVAMRSRQRPMALTPLGCGTTRRRGRGWPDPAFPGRPSLRVSAHFRHSPAPAQPCDQRCRTATCERWAAQARAITIHSVMVHPLQRWRQVPTPVLAPARTHRHRHQEQQYCSQ